MDHTEASVDRLVEVVTMLMRTDPFHELDRFSQQVFGTQGTMARPSVMPMDAWRDGDTFVVELDLPGVSPELIDLDVERNVVTVRAERANRNENIEMLAAERPRGVFSRQLVVGDTLDTDNITASYDAGVLSLKIPVAEKSKPRKINIGTSDSDSDHHVITQDFTNGDRQAVNA
jgi:HSP20 family protein